MRSKADLETPLKKCPFQLEKIGTTALLSSLPMDVPVQTAALTPTVASRKPPPGIFLPSMAWTTDRKQAEREKKRLLSWQAQLAALLERARQSDECATWHLMADTALSQLDRISTSCMSGWSRPSSQAHSQPPDRAHDGGWPKIIQPDSTLHRLPSCVAGLLDARGASRERRFLMRLLEQARRAGPELTTERRASVKTIVNGSLLHDIGTMAPAMLGVLSHQGCEAGEPRSTP